MKLIVAGGRDFNDYDLVKKTLSYIKVPFEIVCGEAKGADSLGRRYAVENSIPIHSFPADWDTNGKSAGYKRNVKMAEFSDACVAFWDGSSKGTKHMINIATRLGLKLVVVKY